MSSFKCKNKMCEFGDLDIDVKCPKCDIPLKPRLDIKTLISTILMCLFFMGLGSYITLKYNNFTVERQCNEFLIENYGFVKVPFVNLSKFYNHENIYDVNVTNISDDEVLIEYIKCNESEDCEQKLNAEQEKTKSKKKHYLE